MGKHFDNICRIDIKNADKTALEYAKKLVLASKNIAENK